MQTRYRVLRLVAWGFQIIGWIVILGGIISGLAVCILSTFGIAALGNSTDPNVAALAASGIFGGIVGGVAIILYAGFVGLALVAAGQLYFVMMDIEENTRATRLLVERDLTARQTARPPQPPQA